MADVYYNRFPGDYARDTRRLSLAEHGAYTLLLDEYYTTGPLPTALEALYRVCGAQDDHERDAVRSVATRFFPLLKTDGLRHNKRADLEIKRRAEFISEQRRKANVRWHPEDAAAYAPALPKDMPNGMPNGMPNTMPKGMPKACPPSPSPSPTPKPSPSPSLAGAREDGFAQFWDAYPRKVGREAALRAWLSVVVNGDAKEIMAALSWQREQPEWTRDGGRFVPKPENYLFDRRWTDERPRDPFLDGEEPF